MKTKRNDDHSGPSAAATAGPGSTAASKVTAESPTGDRHLPWHRLSYTTQMIGLLLILGVASAVQTGLDLAVRSDHALAFRATIGSGVVIAVGLALQWRGRTVYHYLSTVQASVVLLGTVLLGTVMGTMVLQGLSNKEFSEHYGAAAPVLNALFLDDVFHSLAFMTLLFLCAAASAVSVIRRWHTLMRWKNVGLLATHVSILVVLGGGLIGYLSAKKGMVHLQVGESKEEFLAKTPRSGSEKAEPMGFALRLDRFELDKYQQEFNVYTYSKDENGKYKVLASDHAALGARVGAPAPGTDTELRITRILNNATPTAQAGGTHVLTFSGGSKTVVLGQNYTMPNGLQVAVDGYFPDFTFDMASHKATSRSNVPRNPTLAVRTALPGADLKDAHPQYLFAREDMRDMMAGNGHPDETGLTYSLQASADGKLASAWTEGMVGQSNPAIEVEVRRAGHAAQKLVLVAADEEPIDLGSGRMLVYGEKPNMVKNYQSTISVMRNGRALLTRVIKVNDPLVFEGISVYQANYDPKNPNYSGLEIVRDPGLPLVNAGFWILMLGTLHAVALRNRRMPWKRPQLPSSVATAGGVGGVA